MTPRRYTPAVWAVALGAALLPCAAHPQAFPVKPVRVIVPFTAGSAVDAAARINGQRLSEMWKQQVIIDNPSAPTP